MKEWRIQLHDAKASNPEPFEMRSRSSASETNPPQKKNTGDSKGVPLWEAHKIITCDVVDIGLENIVNSKKMKIIRRKACRVGDVDHKCPVAGFDYYVYKSFASNFWHRRRSSDVSVCLLLSPILMILDLVACFTSTISYTSWQLYSSCEYESRSSSFKRLSPFASPPGSSFRIADGSRRHSDGKKFQINDIHGCILYATVYIDFAGFFFFF